MDVLREVFGYPFMELVHPTGRKKLVSKEGPQTGAAYGYRIGGTFMSPVGVKSKGIRFRYQNNSIRILKMKRHA